MTLSMRLVEGIGAFASEYDGFLLDLWGVIHDGERPYEGAVEALRYLREGGWPTVLLSNAPRLGVSVVRTMAQMGIGRDLYGEVLTSGDVVRQALIDRDDPLFAALGDRCLFIGPERDFDILEGTGVRQVDEPRDASFVLCTGPVALSETEEDYIDVLRACARSTLPMVCANPDHAVVRGGKRVMCAGALAAVYASLGPTVVYRGKPDPVVFQEARQKLGLGENARVAMIGDGVQTDLPGARAAGIDGVFVCGGLNARALGVEHGEMPPVGALAAYLEGEAPVAVLPAFRV